MAVSQEEVFEVLKDCYDPEIPVNIVDLGLVYGVDIEEQKVHVTMTLTSPGCPSGPYIGEQIRHKVLGIEGIHDATIEFVWEPVWGPERMSEEAKAELGMDDDWDDDE
jgi:FeS assembly SUF system protein